MSRWEDTPFFKVRVSGGAVDTVSITGCDGDADGAYKILVDWYNTAGTNRDLEIRFNGINTNHISNYRRDSPPYNVSKNPGCAFGFCWGGVVRSEITVYASRYPRGSTVAHPRTVFAESTFWTYFAGDAIILCSSYGLWNDTSTLLTSMDIVCTSNGSATKQANIGNDSVIQAFRLAQ